MPLILRVDVDKPYGSSNLFQRIISKLREDYWFPVISGLGYLHSVEEFLAYCNSENIPGMIHFRNCTLPSSTVFQLLEEGNYLIGFHAENTRSFATFSHELNLFRSNVQGKPVPTFSKHGSGFYKLGKNHYAPYEPEKYIEWAEKLHIKFPFGNGIATSKNDFVNSNTFYPKVFWVEREHQSSDFSSLEAVVAIAQDHIVPVLIHPENFCSTKAVREDFEKLIRLSKEARVEWTLYKS